MSLSGQYDQLVNSYTLGSLSKEIPIDARLKIPETTPGIEAIIGGDFQIDSPEVSVNEGFLVISGVIYPQLLYASSDAGAEKHSRQITESQDTDESSEHDNHPYPLEYSYNWSGDEGVLFEEHIDIPGLHADSVVDVKLIPKSADFEKISTDRVIFTAKIDLVTQSSSKQKSSIITGLVIQPADKVTVSKESASTEELVAIKRTVASVRTSLQLPGIKPGIARILKNVAKPSSISWEYNRGKIYLKGLLDVGVIYVGLDDDVLPTEVFANEWSRDFENAVPFETSFETDLPEEGLVVLPSVTPINIQVEIASRRELHVQINLLFQTALSRVFSWEIVTNATPTPGIIIDTQKTLLSYEEYLGETSGEIPFELTADLPASQPGVERILAYQGRLNEIKIEAVEGNATIESNLDLAVFYTADGTEATGLRIANWETRNNNGIPLNGMIDFPNLQTNSLLRGQTTIESLKVELVGERTIKISGLVRAQLSARSPRTITVLEDLAEVIPVDPESRPSLLFYIAQPGDTLWKIARRYQTTVAQLVQTNQIIHPGRIEIGQKLIIPKQITHT